MIKKIGKSYAIGAVLVLGLLAGCTAQPTSPPQATTAAPAPVPQLAGAWYQVQFESSKFDLDSRGKMIIETVAAIAKHNPPARVTVIGKTDSVGTQNANLALSRSRATQVRDALIVAGIPAAQIDTRWTGEGSQEVATADQVDQPRNRVVDITVVKEAF